MSASPHYIAANRATLVAGLSRLAQARGVNLRNMATLLDACFHARFRGRLEELKGTYEPFNPDAPPSENVAAEPRLREALATVLQQSNFTQLSEQDVLRSVHGEGIFPVSYDVDLHSLKRWQVWVRGETMQTLTRSSWLGLRRYTVEFAAYRRVFLALEFAPREPRGWARWMERLRPRLLDHVHQPGRVYLKLIRNIPKADLEIVFPDPVPRMKNTQVLQVAVPFLSGVGLLLWEWVIKPMASGVSSSMGTAALTAVALALGGHAWKTWKGYRAAVRDFLNEVTHSLYFRSVALNGGVLQSLVDAAEEEEAKESLLAYAALLDGPATGAELAARAGALLQQVLGSGGGEAAVSVVDGLHTLEGLGVCRCQDGVWTALPVPETCARLRTVVMETLPQ